MGETPFYKMKGSSALGYGNQHSSTKGMPFKSPAKATETGIEEKSSKPSDLMTVDAGKDKGTVYSKATQNLINNDAPKEVIQKSKDKDVANFKASKTT